MLCGQRPKACFNALHHCYCAISYGLYTTPLFSLIPMMCMMVTMAMTCVVYTCTVHGGVQPLPEVLHQPGGCAWAALYVSMLGRSRDCCVTIMWPDTYVGCILALFIIEVFLLSLPSLLLWAMDWGLEVALMSKPCNSAQFTRPCWLQLFLRFSLISICGYRTCEWECGVCCCVPASCWCVSVCHWDDQRIWGWFLIWHSSSLSSSSWWPS